MQLDIITAITCRAKAKYSAEKAWFEIHADESWTLTVWVSIATSVLGGHASVVGKGVKFEELPALLNSLK